MTTFILGSIYGLVAIGMTPDLRGAADPRHVAGLHGHDRQLRRAGECWSSRAEARSSPSLLAFAATFLLGTFTQLVSVQPLMKRRHEIDFEMITFITTFAVAIVFTNVALEILGPQQRNVTPSSPAGSTSTTASTCPISRWPWRSCRSCSWPGSACSSPAPGGGWPSAPWRRTWTRRASWACRSASSTRSRWASPPRWPASPACSSAGCTSPPRRPATSRCSMRSSW